MCTRLRPAGRRPQAHSIQKQIRVVVAEPGLMKLFHRVVEMAGQLRYRLRTHHFAGQRGHHSPHLPGRDAAQKGFADEHGGANTAWNDAAAAPSSFTLPDTIREELQQKMNGRFAGRTLGLR